MKIEHTYRWMTKWNGKMSPTRYHCTEEQIRKSHPEAVRIDSSLVMQQIPETPEEWATRLRAVDTAFIGSSVIKHGGTILPP